MVACVKFFIWNLCIISLICCSRVEPQNGMVAIGNNFEAGAERVWGFNCI